MLKNNTFAKSMSDMLFEMIEMSSAELYNINAAELLIAMRKTLDTLDDEMISPERRSVLYLLIDTCLDQEDEYEVALDEYCGFESTMC